MHFTTRVQAVCVGSLAILLYANTWNHSYALDDVATISANRFVQMGWKGIPEMFRHTLWFGYDGYESVNSYRPLAHATFAVEYALAGELRPDVSHIVNTLIYALVCVLLWHVLRRLFPAQGLMVFCAALLFTAHPVHTESIVNLKNRDELMALLLGLLSLLMLFRWLSSSRWQWLSMALVYYGLALLCKESLIAWIFIFPLAGYYFLAESSLQQQGKKLLLLSLSFIAVFTLVWSWRAQIVAAVPPPPKPDYWNNPILLANSWTTALGTKLYVLGKYLQLSIVPHTLTCSYFYNDLPLLPFWHWKSLLSLLTYAVLLYGLYRYLPTRHPLGFAIAFYLITLAMFSNFFMFYYYTAALSERFLLIPTIGVCLAGGYGLHQLAMQGYKLVRGLITFLIIILSLKTIMRNRAWKDNLTIAQTDLQNSPQSYLLHSTMALELFKKAQREANPFLLQQALPYFQKAVELDGEDPITWEHYGRTLALLGDYHQAAECFRRALQINPAAGHVRLLLERAQQSSSKTKQ